MPLEIKWLQAGFVTEMRTGKRFGKTDHVEAALPKAGPLILSVLPYEVKGLKVDIGQGKITGGRLAIDLSVDASGTLIDHVVHAEFIDGQGQVVPESVVNLPLVKGRYKGGDRLLVRARCWPLDASSAGRRQHSNCGGFGVAVKGVLRNERIDRPCCSWPCWSFHVSPSRPCNPIRQPHPSEMLADDLVRYAHMALASRQAEYEKLKTPEQIAAYQERLRWVLLETLGEFPEKTPLNAKVTGHTRCDGYRIEKILFESRPGGCS